jgi:hypothetical protein
VGWRRLITVILETQRVILIFGFLFHALMHATGILGSVLCTTEIPESDCGVHGTGGDDFIFDL